VVIGSRLEWSAGTIVIVLGQSFFQESWVVHVGHHWVASHSLAKVQQEALRSLMMQKKQYRGMFGCIWNAIFIYPRLDWADPEVALLFLWSYLCSKSFTKQFAEDRFPG
jgi:hypothetical protein